MSYVVSLALGLAVGVAYGLVGVRSPAPPFAALLGSLGMLAGEAAVGFARRPHGGRQAAGAGTIEPSAGPTAVPPSRTGAAPLDDAR